MSAEEKRAACRERVRRFRARQRGEEYAPPKRRCAECGCYLSRYAHDLERYCAPCFTRLGTHEEYTALRDAGTGIRGADVCKRGHDLTIHGRLETSGRERKTRRCQACRAELRRSKAIR